MTVSSHMAGRQAINRTRETAQQTAGGAFDIRGFPDALLTSGEAPLSVSDRFVRDWAARQRRG